MSLQCAFTAFGIGEPCDIAPSFIQAKDLFLTKPGYSFTDMVSFSTQADWNTAIAAGNIIPLLNIQNVEPTDVEKAPFESDSGEKTTNLRGLRGAIYSFKWTADQHQIAYENYNGKRWRYFWADRNGVIVGAKNSDGTIQGFDVGYLEVNIKATPSADNILSQMEIQESQIDQLDTEGFYLKPSWRVPSLKPMTKVVLTTGTVAANAFTATVTYINQSTSTTAGLNVSEPISGLLIGDFEVINDTGSVITPDSVTEQVATPGTYDIDCTTATITSGSCEVIGSAANKFHSEVVTVS